MATTTIHIDYMLAISNTVRRLYKNVHAICFEAVKVQSITGKSNCNDQDETKPIPYGTNFAEKRSRSVSTVCSWTKAKYFLFGQKLSSTNRGTFPHLFVGTEK
jgi:hypothetical protein